MSETTAAESPDHFIGPWGTGPAERRAAVVSDVADSAASPAALKGAAGPILVVAPQPFYEDRGTPIAIYSVLQALSQLHYRVDLLTYPVGRPVEIRGLSVIRAPNPFGIRRVPVGFSIRKLLLDLTLVFAMWRRLARHRYACIHAVEEAAFPAAVLGRRYGVPVIYDMQSSLPEQMVTHRAFRSRLMQDALAACERWVLRRADAVVSSAGLLPRVAAAAPRTPAYEWHFPIEVAPRDTEAAAVRLRAELALAPDARVVVYAGTFEPYQGLPLLLDALPMVRAAVPTVVFVLVGGEGEQAEAIRREAAERGFGPALRVIGRKPREQVPGYLAMADVLVSPRRYGDNLPLKVFGYLAAGRPIVATDLPAHRAVLDETRAVLTEVSPGALAQAIVKLLAHPDEAARLATAASEYAAQRLGWQRFVDSVAGICEGVAARADDRPTA
ncbi:MAG TPA: glycosyltransferase family 4 protein [Gemmatimonadales bacterium]|nr:glycosyltransferase family 4 protein [Gemmatimonadales bacterium]